MRQLVHNFEQSVTSFDRFEGTTDDKLLPHDIPQKVLALGSLCFREVPCVPVNFPEFGELWKVAQVHHQMPAVGLLLLKSRNLLFRQGPESVELILLLFELGFRELLNRFEERGHMFTEFVVADLLFIFHATFGPFEPRLFPAHYFLSA